ncbi:hypothetical protein VNO77_06092 [Canavalia gladiata]|uniref:Uncharacterized protein n=1 Tax=Canavalia gladiata TaxID=3824 RepID=A0AAN9N081_CANGL
MEAIIGDTFLHMPEKEEKKMDIIADKASEAAKGSSNSCSEGWYTGHSGISLVHCRSVKSNLPDFNEICLHAGQEIEFLAFVFLVLQYLATLGAPILFDHNAGMLKQTQCVGVGVCLSPLLLFPGLIPLQYSVSTFVSIPPKNKYDLTEKQAVCFMELAVKEIGCGADGSLLCIQMGDRRAKQDGGKRVARRNGGGGSESRCPSTLTCSPLALALLSIKLL